jgi:molybdate transport system regulatory protein
VAKATLRVRSALTLETRAGALAGKRWMELLARIGVSHSIAAAAKAVGLSYKAAWDAVEAMNNFSDRPLVRRFKGGKGGGGTRLTARGRQLVGTYRAVEVENNRFLSLLNARIRNLDQDLRLIGRLTMLTSARNHFAGIVTRIRRGSVNDEVELLLSGGEQLSAIVTHESVQNLGLKLGVEVVALVKASWVIVAPGSGSRLKLSARNQLTGTIRRLLPGAVNTEVVIGLKGGNSVAAIITNGAVKELKLVEGKRARAIFKASSVILGVAS